MPFHNLSFLMDMWKIFTGKLLVFVTDFEGMTYKVWRQQAWIVCRMPGGFNNLKCLIYPSCQECPEKGVQGK